MRNARNSMTRWAHCATLAFAVAITAWSAIALTAHDGRLSAVWITNGLWLGAVLMAPKLRVYLLAAGFAGDLAANLLVGDAVRVAIILAGCNLMEVAVSAFLLPIGAEQDLRLSRQRNLLLFFGVGVLASPLLAALCASLALAATGVEPFSAGFVHWFLADALGVGLVTPVMLAADAGELGRLFAPKRRWPAAWRMLLFALTVTAVFGQDRYPLLFLVPPVLALVAAELGAAANSLTIPFLAVAAFGGTLTGHGPFNLNQGLGTDERLMLIQAFMLSAFALAAWISNVATARAEALRDLAVANAQLQALASTDPLTGLANRREFDRALLRELQLSARGAGPLSLMLVDIDHFKRINDTLGHAAGDERLREVAGRVQIAARRANDVAARIGGEEFALILPATGPESARRIGDRLRADISRLRWDTTDERLSRMTVSIGIATLEQPDASVTAEALLAVADTRLYDAKREGRDRVRLQIYGAAVEDVPVLRLVSGGV